MRACSQARTERLGGDKSQAVNRLLCAAALALTSLGCRNIDRFDTENGAAYCGSMLNFQQRGFVDTDIEDRPNLKLMLELDTDSLTVQPGAITTNDPKGLCDPDPLFVAAPLRAIPEVLNDPISLLEFGDGREYNFFAWADSTCQGTVLAVVSLMKNDSVEVRLLKPRPKPVENAPEEDQPGFILFQLARSEIRCW
jgi:hypothetical protein